MDVTHRQFRLFILLACAGLSSLCAAQSTPFGKGVFRYAPYGHSLLADEHPYFVRFDAGWQTNHPEWDWGQTGKAMRVSTFGVFGINLPLWRGDIRSEQYALSVTWPVSATIWLDLGEPVTAPVVNQDWRISLPVCTFLHRLNRGFVQNYSVTFAPFKHESTHIGDELVLQHTDQGYPLRRVNVSYNYSEYVFTLNDPENFREQAHTFRAGLMLLWNWKKGWYFIHETDGDATLAQPRLSPWEAYLQYQYQSSVSKHGFQGVASIEIRNRALYGYPVFTWEAQTKSLKSEPQQETRVFTYNVFAGVRYCNPLYDGYFSRVAVGIRAYHGNTPYGQFRNHRNYNHIGVCLLFE